MNSLSLRSCISTDIPIPGRNECQPGGAPCSRPAQASSLTSPGQAAGRSSVTADVRPLIARHIAMKSKDKKPTVFTTEGPGPREYELARWEFLENGRTWILIAHLNPSARDEVLLESGPKSPGHWGHESGGSSMQVAALLEGQELPKWTHATERNRLDIVSSLKRMRA